jgi:hypothetical protein
MKSGRAVLCLRRRGQQREVVLMPATSLTEAERIRRREYVRDTRGANRQRISVEKRIKQRDDAAAEWAQWFRQKMESNGCDDPVQLLPDAFAMLEQQIDDRVAAAIAEFKQTLRKAFQ